MSKENEVYPPLCVRADGLQSNERTVEKQTERDIQKNPIPTVSVVN
jgi:hypothetical protein